MKKRILLLIALLVLPNITLAGKPVKPPNVDLEAMLEIETQERMDADSDLQNQIDNIQLIEGPPGPPGPQGIQGQAGVNGTNGTNGIDVFDGFEMFGLNNDSYLFVCGIHIFIKPETITLGPGNTNSP